MPRAVGDQKVCARCAKTKHVSEYGDNRRYFDKLQSYCNQCDADRNTEWRIKHPTAAKDRARRGYLTRDHEKRSYWIKSHPNVRLLAAAKARARERGLPCTLTLDDITIPDVCPVLGLPLYFAAHYVKQSSPSIDRIVPELGYTPENCRVISHRANSLKSNATLEEMRLIVADLERLKRDQDENS